jgi:RNA polymerase sigma factor (sigma-70 family)
MSPDGDPAETKRNDGGSGDADPGDCRENGLARRFARGESTATTTARQLIGKVVRFRGYFIPADQRADIVQDSLVDVLREAKERDFAGDDEFHGFIRVVAYRRCIDWVRRSTRRSPASSPVASTIQPEEALLKKERRELAAKVIFRLRKPCRELFALRIGRGMSYGEIATMLGRSEGALRTQASECLRQARQILRRMRSRIRLAATRERKRNEP